jgi:hypothetical protein
MQIRVAMSVELIINCYHIMVNYQFRHADISCLFFALEAGNMHAEVDLLISLKIRCTNVTIIDMTAC